ncbi:MAG TPA: hypothetical protein VFE59_10810 [Trebonia sp.]|nr:hypothetical protein [Trebonia sp.]
MIVLGNLTSGVSAAVALPVLFGCAVAYGFGLAWLGVRARPRCRVPGVHDHLRPQLPERGNARADHAARRLSARATMSPGGGGDEGPAGERWPGGPLMISFAARSRDSRGVPAIAAATSD